MSRISEKASPDGSAWPTLGHVSAFWAAYIAILFLAAMVKGMAPAHWGQLAWGLTSTAAILLLTLAILNREHRSFRDIGLNLNPTSIIRFLVGTLIGVGTYAAMILANMLVSGPVHLVSNGAPDGGAIFLTVASVVALGSMEELGFRGYPLRTLVPALGPWPAQAIVAVAFGLSHLLFGWTWEAVLVGVLPSALLFGAAALASRGLAMPLGLHAALNLARWAAGETETPGIWTMVVDEQARGHLATSAPFIGVAITLLFTGALWVWYLRRGCDARPTAD